MHEIDTPFSRRSKTFDEHIEVDLDIAIHGEHSETIQTLLAAACTKEGLDTPQGTDTPLAGASSHRKHAELDQQNHNVRVDHEALRVKSASSVSSLLGMHHTAGHTLGSEK